MHKTKLFFGRGISMLLVSAMVAMLLPSEAVAANGHATATQGVTQATVVKGRVLDNTGEPLLGVTIMSATTKAGAVTDIDGNFTFDTAKGKSATFSYAGYKSQTVTLRDGMTITLEPDLVGLEDVVVIGYGTMKKRDLTGSISSVKAEDIARVPTSNVMEALQGQVAGLDITRSNGDANSQVNMTLRGNRSINGSNAPLFIIDGMEGSYDELNPNDIASVEVLKDASSTAIYGASGANGVIIITTKNPKKDRLSINLDAYVGVNTITSFPDMMRGDEYINFRREAQKAAGLWSSPADDATLFPVEYQKLIDEGKWVDWFDEASRTGMTQSYNLSTTYSSNKVDSYFSLGYYDMQGLLKNDELQRYSARAKFDVKANDIVKYGLNIYAMYSDNDRRYDRIWNRVLCMPPLGNVYNDDGTLCNYPLGNGDMNPLADMNKGAYSDKVKTLSVTPQAYIEITPLKGLSFKSVLGGYFRNVREDMYTGTQGYQSLESNKVYAQIPNTLTYNYKWQNILTYDFTLLNDHHFTVTGVAEWGKDRKESVSVRANGFDTDYYQYNNIGASTGTPEISSGYVQSTRMSYVARLNYSYKGKYLLSLSNRWDGSSMLADGKKWSSFPAAAIGWRISDEKFMESVDPISNLKLRASYGITGNAGASEYATLDFSRTGIFGFQDQQVSFSGYSNHIANLDLGWEKSYMWNVGFDLGLLRDRISLTFDWYSTTTRDILYEKGLPYATGGFASSPFKIWSNVGKTRNSGIEIGLTTRNFVGKTFSWTTTFTFAANKERVLKTTSDGPLAFGDFYLIPGESMHTYYGYKYDGIWGTNEAEEAAKYGMKPGNIRVAEAGEKDYKLNADDYQVLGSQTPKWSGSMLNNFQYKNFDLSVLLITRWDWTIHYGLTGWYRCTGLAPSPSICDYWTPEHQNARYPSPNAQTEENVAYRDTPNYFDGSYIKIKNISLGYTLPKSLLQKVKIEKARVYFTANNPFIFAKCKYLKNYDPEKGGDEEAAPLSKQFVFGVNLSF